MEGPSDLRHNRGHAKEIHTNDSNIQTARNNLVSTNSITSHSFNKYLISSYCVHASVLAVATSRKSKQIWSLPSLFYSNGGKDQHLLRPRNTQTKITALRNAERERERERLYNKTPSSRIYTCCVGKGNSLRTGYLIRDLKVGPNVHQLMINQIFTE